MTRAIKPRVKVKVCGITRLEDAMVAVEAGVDALGFIFYRKSPRNIKPETAREIIDQLPPFVDVVGVFVDKKREELEEIVQYCRLGYVQLHGNETPKYCERLARFAAPCQVLKALRVGGDMDTSRLAEYNDFVRGFLLDTYDKNMAGGTGKSFDWSLIARLDLKKPYILAGGLNSENIAQAVQAVQPYGVDINSGVEQEPGIKDHGKIIETVGVIRSLE